MVNLEDTDTTHPVPCNIQYLSISIVRIGFHIENVSSSWKVRMDETQNKQDSRPREDGDVPAWQIRGV